MPLKPGGVGQYFCDGVLVREVETTTCGHCQTVVEIQNRRRLTEVADFCRVCMRLVCLGCAGKGCTPLEKKVDKMEAEHYRRRQFAKEAGL